MKWNTQRKLTVGVLVLAAAALGVDQFVLRGGSGEPSADAAAPPGPAGRAGGGSGRRGGQRPDGRPFDRRRRPAGRPRPGPPPYRR
jgi:hypothetical protein